MSDEREQAIAAIVEAIRQYDYGSALDAAKKLADLKDPPLPNQIEVLVTRNPASASEWWPDGWGSVFGTSLDPAVNDEQVYRCKLTPLERVK